MDGGREIREGDWLIKNGEPWIYYCAGGREDPTLRHPGALVEKFDEMIEDWITNYKQLQEEVADHHSLKKSHIMLQADRAELVETLEETQAELDQAKKALGILVDDEGKRPCPLGEPEDVWTSDGYSKDRRSRAILRDCPNRKPCPVCAKVKAEEAGS